MQQTPDIDQTHSTQQLHHIRLDVAEVFIADKLKDTSGSDAVRQLFALACDRLQLTDRLDESTLPYRLADSKNIVSFSHSRHQVALAIATAPLQGLGIDIEDNQVSMSVARRFFAPEEVAWLARLEKENTQHTMPKLPTNTQTPTPTMPKNHITAQTNTLKTSTAQATSIQATSIQASRLLWMAKEAYTKASHHPDSPSVLMHNLKISLLPVLRAFENNPLSATLSIAGHDYHFYTDGDMVLCWAM